jgi:hypothetical protein
MWPAAAGGGASGKKPRFLPEARWAGQEPGSSDSEKPAANLFQ